MRLSYIYLFLLCSFIGFGQEKNNYLKSDIVIYTSENITDGSFLRNLNDYMNEYSFIKKTNRLEKSDINLYIDNGFYFVEDTESKNPLYKIKISEDKQVFKVLNSILYPIYFKKIQLDNHNIEFKFKQIEDPFFSDSVIENKIKKYDKDTVFKVVAGEDHVIFSIKNNTKKNLFFSIYEVGGTSISKFAPNNNCVAFGEERLIPPGKEVDFKDCAYSFAPPYEILTLKIFTSEIPINFDFLTENIKNEEGFEKLKSNINKIGITNFKYQIVLNKNEKGINSPIIIDETIKEKPLNELLVKLENYNFNTNNNISKEATKKAPSFLDFKKHNKQRFYYKELLKKDSIINYQKEKIFSLQKLLEAKRGGIALSVKEKVSDFSKDLTYKALLIAVDTYTDNEIKDLEYPVKDAISLKKVLVENYSFNEEDVVFLKNPTLKEVTNTFKDYYLNNTTDTNWVIFYAGHGFYDNDFKRGYWLTSDSKMDDQNTWLRNTDIVDYISHTKSKHTLLISDACFSGAIFKFRDISRKESLVLNRIMEKQSRKGMTSGLLKQVPDNSIFIKYLLKSLKENKKDYLLTSELFSLIQEPILSNTDNIPQYEVIQNTNHEGGEFVFFKK